MTARRVALIALPAYWIALFTATHYPRVRLPDEIPSSDKLVHFAAFALLAFLYWRFALAIGRAGKHFVWTAAVILLAYAALDEYLQQFFGRYTDLMDFIANAAGIVTVLGGITALRARAARRAR